MEPGVGKRRFSLSLVLVSALILCLPVLALLQYRLLGQVSESERERMQNNLRAGAAKFCKDFDREITRAFLCFQADASAPPEKIWDNYPSRYDHWTSDAPYPGLVSRVFRVEGRENGSLSLFALDPSSKKFEPREWPIEFAELRRKIEQSRERLRKLQLHTLPIVRGPDAPSEGKQGLMTSSSISLVLKNLTGPIEESIPALTIPVISINPASGRFLPDSGPGIIIVQLDADYIRNEFVPALARRHFATGDKLDYKLAVVSRDDPQNLFYKSDEDVSAADLSSSEATDHLLALRMEEMETFAQEGFSQMRDSSGQRRVFVDRVAVQVLSPGPALRPLRTPDGNEGLWQIALKHREGSLETVVAIARRRNLTISLGILIVLGASATMIIISSRRAERLARQQMEFVAGVSHELRTPLAVIRSAGENLADGVILDGDQVRRYGSLIAGEGRRLTEMVEQVLEFSGIQSGRKAYQLSPVQIRDVIAEALSACRPMIEEDGFEVEEEIETNLPLIAADRAALVRAIQNLLSNAIKYSGESRRIKIRAAAGERASGVEITIEDRGIGIESGDLPHIFEPFHRGRVPLATRIHGNGLGLSLVRHIIAAHGGSVSVESAAGRGSSFTLYLPLKTSDSLDSYEQTNSAR